MLAVGQLQALGQGQGLGSARHEGHQGRQAQALGPGDAAAPVLVGLEGGIEQQQGTPSLQQG